MIQIEKLLKYLHYLLIIQTNEYLTYEDLDLKPNAIEQARFEYSPFGKIFNKGLNKDDKKEGLSKRLKNIENAQKGLINGNNKNKPDSASSKLSISSVFEIILSESKDEDVDENKKTARELYQDGIEGMKGLKLPGEIEIKNEQSQMYLENNINKIKNIFSDIYDKYQRFQSILLIKKKKVLSTNYFHIELMIVIFMIDVIHCTIT